MERAPVGELQEVTALDVTPTPAFHDIVDVLETYLEIKRELPLGHVTAGEPATNSEHRVLGQFRSVMLRANPNKIGSPVAPMPVPALNALRVQPCRVSVSQRAARLRRHVRHVCESWCAEQMPPPWVLHPVNQVDARIIVTDTSRGVTRMADFVACRDLLSTGQNPSDSVSVKQRPQFHFCIPKVVARSGMEPTRVRFLDSRPESHYLGFSKMNLHRKLPLSVSCPRSVSSRRGGTSMDILP